MSTHPYDTTLGDIVARDYRAAAVLERFGLDFCCGGRRTLDEACGAKNVSPQQVAAALDELTGSAPSDAPDRSWDAGALITHIVSVHHAYVREALPSITAHLEKLVRAHGERHPELLRIAEHVDNVARDMKTHMFKEEEVLFPYVRALQAAVTHGAPPPPNMFGTVQNPIRMMEIEHAAAGNELEVIRELTNNYTVPADGCTTYRVCFRELEAFDADLRRHVHLENNVLFPKALGLESELAFGAGHVGRLACREVGQFPGI